ncbi:MAG: helix-turn-helix transcriptional regulator [bacterium]
MGISRDDKLAKKIRRLRSEFGLTQEQFAVKIGVTFSTVNRWENGKSKPSPLALKRIEELDENKDRK